MGKKTDEDGLCSARELEDTWNLTKSLTNNNVYKNYTSNPKKKKQFEIIDMGVFCKINDITPDMLRLAVKQIKETASLISGETLETHNKIVVMSEEDYEEYEQFKNFKHFNENKKANK